MPATHSPMPARAWIVRLARVCWERKTLSIIVIVASVSTIFTGCADAANNASGRQ
ncbi:ATP-binding protein [Salmonella enterica subsp. enterica serovar Heidelberg]|nr:ATP-binding protein [Salmonella enterica subsp. enterica serovar Heidelberg]